MSTPYVLLYKAAVSLLQVPGDPKMMIAPIKEKELAAFSLTSLERAPVRNLCLQPDLGIPLSYLDMGVYAVPAQPQALAPEDAALVQVPHLISAGFVQALGPTSSRLAAPVFAMHVLTCPRW